MKKLAIWSVVIIGIALAAIYGVYRFAESREFFVPEISALLLEETGLQVSREGEVGFTLLPRPTLHIRDVVISNPQVTPESVLARIDSLAAAVDWSVPFQEKPEIDLDLNGVGLTLRVLEGDQRNWITEQLLAEPEDVPVKIDEVTIDRARFDYRHEPDNEALVFDLDSLDLDLGAGNARAHVVSGGQVMGARFAAIGNVSFLGDVKLLDVNLELLAGESRELDVTEVELDSVSDWLENVAPAFPARGTLSGTVGFADDEPVGELKVDARVDDLGELSFLDGADLVNLEDVGPAEGSVVLRLGDHDLDLRRISATIDQPGRTVSVTGFAENLLTDPAMTLTATGNVDHPHQIPLVRDLLIDYERYLRLVGAVHAEAEIHIHDESLSVTDLDAEVFSVEGGGSVTLQGSLGQLPAAPELNLDAQLSLQHPGKVPLLGELLPEQASYLALLGPVSAGGNIKLEDNNLSISNFTTDFSVASYTGHLEGLANGPLDALTAELRHTGEAEDVLVLLRELDIDTPVNLPELGAGRLELALSASEGQLYLDSASLGLQDGNIDLDVSGDVERPIEADSALDARVQLSIGSLAPLANAFPEDMRPLISDFGLDLATRVSGPLQAIALDVDSLRLFGERGEIQVDGVLAWRDGEPVSDLGLKLTTYEPLAIDRYFGELEGLQLTRPIDLSARLSSRGMAVEAREISLSAKGIELTGRLDTDFSQDPFPLTAVLHATEFTSGLFRPEDDEAAPPPLPEADLEEPDVDPGEVFETYTEGFIIETDWIRELDIDIIFTADRAYVSGYDLENLEIVLGIDHGLLNLSTYRLILDGRPSVLRGFIDTNPTPPIYHVEGEIDGNTLESLLKLEDNLLEGGQLSGNFNLNSRGETVGELLQNLSGRSLTLMGPLVIRSRALSIVSSDMLSSMLGGIVRNDEDRTSSAYDCAVLGIDVQDGVARIDRTFSMEAQDYNLAGRGEIDLTTGYIDLRVYPKARRGLGFSVSTLVNGFRIRGHMATPDFSVGGGGLLTALVAGYALTPTLAATAANPITASVAVTGLLAKGFFDRLTSSSFTCENTLARFNGTQRQAPVTRPERDWNTKR